MNEWGQYITDKEFWKALALTIVIALFVSVIFVLTQD